MNFTYKNKLLIDKSSVNFYSPGIEVIFSYFYSVLISTKRDNQTFAQTVKQQLKEPESKLFVSVRAVLPNATISVVPEGTNYSISQIIFCSKFEQRGRILKSVYSINDKEKRKLTRS